MTTQTEHASGIPGDEAVQKATGRSWDQWFEALDAAGAGDLDHRGIVERTVDLGGGDWWAQMISVAYEQARGKRVLHQKADGFAVSASRTLGVPVERVYEALVDDERRREWLAEAVTITRSTAGKSVRLRWADGSRVSVNLYPKSGPRTQVTVQHERLADTEQAGLMKRRWAEALDSLRALFEG
jgi:hypothetical protein